MTAVLVFETHAETAAQAVTASLSRRGFVVVRSFDLRSALGSHAGCDCPHHGKAECTCQYVVLLVYGGGAREPAVLTAHSRDGQTRLQVVRDAATRPDPLLVEQILNTLVEASRPAPAQRPEGGDHAPV